MQSTIDLRQQILANARFFYPRKNMEVVITRSEDFFYATLIDIDVNKSRFGFTPIIQSARLKYLQHALEHLLKVCSEKINGPVEMAQAHKTKIRAAVLTMLGYNAFSDADNPRITAKVDTYSDWAFGVYNYTNSKSSNEAAWSTFTSALHSNNPVIKEAATELKELMDV